MRVMLVAVIAVGLSGCADDPSPTGVVGTGGPPKAMCIDDGTTYCAPLGAACDRDSNWYCADATGWCLADRCRAFCGEGSCPDGQHRDWSSTTDKGALCLCVPD